MSTLRTQYPHAPGLLLVLAAVTAIYWPALSGGLHFDDRHNLNGLTAIIDWDSAVNFVFSGRAGHLGRPITLASFSLQAYAWPNHPEIFLYCNILLHILNGALLAWCLLWLGRLRGDSAQKKNWVAIFGTALWLVIPLLASSSLFIVQRMTILSNTFMLAGLIGYLAARYRLNEHPKQALVGMSVSLILGTALATLSKENGVLLPLLVLVIELTLFHARLFQGSNIKRLWGVLFLGLPLVALLMFMATKVPYSEQMVVRREFTAAQRLWTEAEILWQYLISAFLPTPAQLTPFHDHLKASASFLQPVTLLAVTAWVGLVALAIWLRKRLPLLTFAVFWFLTAHLLESTVISLELYFAHRNYLALIGPVYALVASVWSIKSSTATVARLALAGYILILAISLYNFTTLWGNSELASEMWAKYRPESMRANQHLVYYLHQNGHYRAALGVLDETYAASPERRVAVGIQALTLSCVLYPNHDQSVRVDKLISEVKTGHLHLGVPGNLIGLQHLLMQRTCSGVGNDTIQQITLNALDNPAYLGSSTVKHDLFRVLIETGIANHDFNQTVTYLEKSLQIAPSLDGLQFALKILINADRPDLARRFIEMTRNQIPAHPIQRRLWIRQLALFEQQLKT